MDIVPWVAWMVGSHPFARNVSSFCTYIKQTFSAPEPNVKVHACIEVMRCLSVVVSLSHFQFVPRNYQRNFYDISQDAVLNACNFWADLSIYIMALASNCLAYFSTYLQLMNGCRRNIAMRKYLRNY